MVLPALSVHDIEHNTFVLGQRKLGLPLNLARRYAQMIEVSVNGKTVRELRDALKERIHTGGRGVANGKLDPAAFGQLVAVAAAADNPIAEPIEPPQKKARLTRVQKSK